MTTKTTAQLLRESMNITGGVMEAEGQRLSGPHVSSFEMEVERYPDDSLGIAEDDPEWGVLDVEVYFSYYSDDGRYYADKVEVYLPGKNEDIFDTLTARCQKEVQDTANDKSHDAAEEEARENFNEDTDYDQYY